MRLDKHLPPNAIQIRYVHAYYEGVYDDDDNFVEEYCTNEDTATDVYKLIRKAHREKQSYYYRRRTSQLSSDDVRQYRDWTDRQHTTDIPKYNIKVRKLGRRVVIEYNPEYALKMFEIQKQKLINASKPRHKSGPRLYMADIDPQTLAQERARQSIEDMFRDMDRELDTQPMYPSERNEHE
jgi:hypothetical protein